MINQFIIVLFNFGSGIFINGGSPNIIVRILTWISPFRYSCEALFRIFLKDKENVDSVYSQFDYNYGEDFCLYICIGISVLYFFMGWIAVLIKSKRFSK